MTRQILHRWKNDVLWTGEAETVKDALHQALDAGANLRGANLTGANLMDAALRFADLSGADLTGANLTGAVLRFANLTGANLTGAVLRFADLSGADLSGANLSGADLSDADLMGANLSGANLMDANLTGADLSGANLRFADLRGVPVVPEIDRAILAAIKAGGTLNMGDWHTCETTHCRTGWAITLAGEAGKALEAKIGSAAAGSLIYAVSRPGMCVPDFYADTETAMNDLRACAAKESK